MATLAAVLWAGLRTAATTLPLSYLGQFVFVSVGGSYATGALKLYDLVFNTPYAILRELLFSGFGTATLIVVSSAGKLAAKTTFVILKGATKGAIVVVRLSAASAARFLQANQYLQSDDEPLVFSASNKHTFQVIESLELELTKSELADDWVLIEPDAPDELPSQQARKLLESIDLTDSQIEVYDKNDVHLERPRPGTLEDLQVVWGPEPSAPPDDDLPVLYQESVDQSFIQVPSQ